MCVHDVPENITLVLVSSLFTLHPVSRIVCSPVYSWMNKGIQCIAYNLVYGDSPVYTHCPVQVHPSVQSSVQVYIYVQSNVRLHCIVCIPVQLDTAGIYLEHSFGTVKCTSGHIWYNPQAHLGCTQCSVKSGYVQCIFQWNSLMYASIYQCMSSVYPCTVQCTVCACLFHIYKILWMALTVILTRNGKEQIMNRFKEEREKGTKFRQIENWIAWTLNSSQWCARALSLSYTSSIQKIRNFASWLLGPLFWNCWEQLHLGNQQALQVRDFISESRF